MLVLPGNLGEVADFSLNPNPREFPLGPPQLLVITSKHKEQRKKTHDLKKPLFFFEFKNVIHI